MITSYELLDLGTPCQGSGAEERSDEALTAILDDLGGALLDDYRNVFDAGPWADDE
jgi:hypothetical protein